MQRATALRALADLSGKGLEIGPSHAPLAPRAEGYDVEIVDYLDAEGLRRKYAAAGADVSRVEEVDFIADGRPLPEVIGARHRYDWIIASHVIEHVPDLVQFLRDCEALLKPGGALVLAVPDKRCCFDVLRPVSSVGQVLQAHLDGRTRPVPGVLFDDIAYARRRDASIGWALDDKRPLEAVQPLDFARTHFEQACASDTYVDMHCWVFVPSSFRLIIATLAELGQTGLREAAFRAMGGEFFAVLSREGRNCQADLGTLAQAAREEEAEAVLAAGASTVPLGDLATADHETLRRRLAALEHELAARSATEAELRARLAAMEGARLWRATAPVRAIIDAVRR
ncbi:class I SAM-dependent methyltransferase [Pseudoroseomonas globiformis]|uniref:Class I SAM-dependent methyltransferase n=1 Tax=Teichococcus globiformis TaxID=2307229 RepID=A0ABV7FZX3_9PROT